MDFSQVIKDHNLSDFPIGMAEYKLTNDNSDSNVFDLVVFDGKPEQNQLIENERNLIVLHHGTLSENNSKLLLQYDTLQIIQDDSWELKMLLSKIKEKRQQLFSDFAKNCLIESLFCCQKTKDAVENADIFAPCWQKCSSYFLIDAISALNQIHSNSSSMLDALRKLEKNPINDHISVATQTIGIERAIPTLLERMVKSTIGFSDVVNDSSFSNLIRFKHDYFVSNSMLANCYFYLGYVNRNNFISIKDRLNREQDLFHILKIAFDVEADSNDLIHQSESVKNSANSILEIISTT
ncbi:hypothetical protein [Nitrosopumilus sp.]|uniref:hypothetical protein n=1 Tax=Nitrosopumilus sp. TaxID=2024843 RepID=UPI00260F9B69|nr:hypothetical protein [Nitrosopumilus sp.]